MKKAIKVLVVVFSVFFVLFLLIKFGTNHGVITIEQKTGQDNLTQLCSDKDFVLTLGEFFICR